MRICFDIDGTLCNNTYGKYSEAKPYKNIIKVINRLYEQGNHIILQTARGMKTCDGDKAKAIEMWYDFTDHQLQNWGVKFHELHLGKIEADVYVDDRAMKVNADGTSHRILETLLK